MFRVKSMDEMHDFSNFDAVWARVTDTADDGEAYVPEEIKPEEKICILKRCDKSRAIRFIPEI